MLPSNTNENEEMEVEVNVDDDSDVDDVSNENIDINRDRDKDRDRDGDYQDGKKDTTPYEYIYTGGGLERLSLCNIPFDANLIVNALLQ